MSESHLTGRIKAENRMLKANILEDNYYKLHCDCEKQHAIFRHQAI